MDSHALHRTVLRVLGEIAPEVDLTSVDPTEELRDQLDLDSMDILKLFQAPGIEVPERDYGRILTVDGTISHLTQALAPPT